MRATRKGNGSMKVFGIALVRDEADVIRLSVGHQLSLGLDRVLVVDNGSSDGTTLVLERLSRDDDRIRWSSDAGPYHQAEIMTALAREALRQGADWIVPFDADEFWWVAGGNLRAVLAAVTAGALRAPVVNFVQRRDQLVPAEDALLTMTRRVAAPTKPRQRDGSRLAPEVFRTSSDGTSRSASAARRRRSRSDRGTTTSTGPPAPPPGPPSSSASMRRCAPGPDSSSRRPRACGSRRLPGPGAAGTCAGGGACKSRASWTGSGPQTATSGSRSTCTAPNGRWS